MATGGELAAGLADEINNSLGVILQETQRVDRRLSLDSPSNHEVTGHCQDSQESSQAYPEDRQVVRAIDRIKKIGSRATGIVKNILQFSWRERSVSLQELIDCTIDPGESQVSAAPGGGDQEELRRFASNQKTASAPQQSFTSQAKPERYPPLRRSIVRLVVRKIQCIDILGRGSCQTARPCSREDEPAH
jgi:signal transduction histidine kinase